MLDFPQWRRIWLWGLTLVACLAAVPSFFALTGQDYPDPLKAAYDQSVNLGLDLAGGSHILLEAERSQVAAQRLETMEESVTAEMRRADPRIRIGDISRRDGRLSFMIENPVDVDRARDLIEPLTTGAGLTGQRDWTIRVVDGQRMILTPTEAGMDMAVNNAMETAVEVVRKRIDALGTREPTIIRQGDNRIVVQVPGLQDPGELKALLGQTASLEFKLVDVEASAADTQAGIARPGSQILPGAPGSDYEGATLAVRRLGGIKGDTLTDARQSFDPQTNEPVVNITFDSSGGQRFAKLTRENVNRPFAIILDDQVLSAPNINEPILGGTAQISGGFTVESANNLAISLRSGALPVDLAIVEERTVGPDLGQDSIESGILAMGIGSLLVILLMVVTYGRFGMYSTAALVINVVMILGIMAILNTTLTLPGIAGFVLTIGAAVDANVLINERIREERKRGRRVVAAVENGYKEASRAIYDANVTNFIAGVLLFLFGSGPVRGFAVVLVIGLFTSVFTAVVLTRMWVAMWLRKKRPSDLHI
ncbi:protein translocase subunit SecD [Blastomonas marina]|uniref:protein translocase subunit SecD n=1 Tax=Blastomonas marina TaxID=1867408 RepID=UPI002AC9A7FE|nr:protein translocase subunit SecD [Blastomonas marina]WPZ05120.1 protein translocase subunit SecD [Blastomonas marina]